MASRRGNRLDREKAKLRHKGKAAPLCRCGKRSFKNEFDAAGVQMATGVGCRVYRCEHGPWHITSKKQWVP